MFDRKQRHCIPPCAAYDIPAMESWLEDMAARGLHLQKDGFFLGFATFDVGAPRKERFRLEATDTNAGLFSDEYAPDDGAVQLLHQMGWTHRARRGQFHIYSTADPQAPELNTDPRVQDFTMAALAKLQARSLWNTLLWIVFYTAIYWRKILLTSAVALGSWLAVLFGGLLLWGLFREIHTIVQIFRYRRILQSGELLPHRSNYRRQGSKYLAFGAVRKLLWAVLIVAALVRIAPAIDESAYVSLDGRDFPFPTLSDFFPNAEISQENGILDSAVYSWADPISPENHDYSEYADITIDGRTHSGYLTVQYFRMARPWLARWMAAEMVSQSGDDLADRTIGRLLGHESVVMTPIEGTGADFCVWYYSGLPDPYIILCKDDVVLRLRYAPLGQGPSFRPEELADLILSQIQ